VNDFDGSPACLERSNYQEQKCRKQVCRLQEASSAEAVLTAFVWLRLMSCTNAATSSTNDTASTQARPAAPNSPCSGERAAAIQQLSRLLSGSRQVEDEAERSPAVADRETDVIPARNRQSMLARAVHDDAIGLGGLV
jgi:hypothetical protein